MSKNGSTRVDSFLLLFAVDEIIVAIKVFEKCLKSPNQNVILSFLRKYFEKFHNYILGTVAFLLSELTERLAILVRDTLQLYQVGFDYGRSRDSNATTNTEWITGKMRDDTNPRSEFYLLYFLIPESIIMN